jgi:large subunit ribosomal protein L3
MGNKRTTQRGLEVADIDVERNLLLLKGSVPGSRNALIEVRTDG